MNKRYEALLALKTQEESAKDIVDRIEKLFKSEGAEVEQVQRLERRELSYEHDHQKSAYFVNIIFSAEPALIEKLRSKLKLDDDVAFQNYLVLSQKKAAAPAA
ncbi:MAG: 30S ribosomal protein S6 [Verrucomicrobia bacterium 61-8]|nr:30S ribosomal protein S6 [Verrucomicrobiota bacterium]OJV19788.1 MAG: 30S ribosomal protein S6 [Verrucomicrobia bacterium 61-8]